MNQTQENADDLYSRIETNSSPPARPAIPPHPIHHESTMGGRLSSSAASARRPFELYMPHERSPNGPVTLLLERQPPRGPLLHLRIVCFLLALSSEQEEPFWMFENQQACAAAEDSSPPLCLLSSVFCLLIPVLPSYHMFHNHCSTRIQNTPIPHPILLFTGIRMFHGHCSTSDICSHRDKSKGRAACPQAAAHARRPFERHRAREPYRGGIARRLNRIYCRFKTLKLCSKPSGSSDANGSSIQAINAAHKTGFQPSRRGSTAWEPAVQSA